MQDGARLDEHLVLGVNSLTQFVHLSVAERTELLCGFRDSKCPPGNGSNNSDNSQGSYGIEHIGNQGVIDHTDNTGVVRFNERGGQDTTSRKSEGHKRHECGKDHTGGQQCTGAAVSCQDSTGKEGGNNPRQPGTHTNTDLVDHAGKCKLRNFTNGDVTVNLRNVLGKANTLSNKSLLHINNEGLERQGQCSIVGELNQRVWVTGEQSNSLLLSEGQGLGPCFLESIRLYCLGNQVLDNRLNTIGNWVSNKSKSLCSVRRKVQRLSQASKERLCHTLDVYVLIDQTSDLVDDNLLNFRVRG